MRTLRPLLFLTLAAVLSGCFQTKSLIRLNPDGSGTLEETVLMNSTMAMTVMMGTANLFSENLMDDDAPEASEIADGPYSREQLEQHAADMGATLQSVEPIRITFGAGYTATYTFTDINDLRLGANPMGQMEGMMSELGSGGASDDGEPITFAFSRGQLTVRMPEPTATEEGMDEELEVDFDDILQQDPKKDPDYARGDTNMAGESEGPGDDEFRQMAFMLRDMRFSFAIELPSDVRQTNASHASGRTLTLFDMDFSLLADNPEAFDQLDALGLDGPPDFSMGGMSALQAVPGFTFEPEREVTVSF